MAVYIGAVIQEENVLLHLFNFTLLDFKALIESSKCIFAGN